MSHPASGFTLIEDTLMSITETQGGIDDVHSGSQGLASDGGLYSTW